MARLVRVLRASKENGENGQLVESSESCNGERKLLRKVTEWFMNPPTKGVVFPHKSACILGDTWLFRSMLLSTWSLFLPSKELRITEFIFPTLVLFMNTL
jgi:hypothetical protein